MQNLVSSHLSATDYSYIDKAYKNAAYDDNLRILLIHFHTNGSVYAYNNIGHNTYKQFLQAPSQGRFFWRHIRQNKQKYPHILVAKNCELITQAHFEYAFNAFNLSKNKAPESNALHEIWPQLKKLDKLEDTQKRLDEQHNAGKIDENAYQTACEKIDTDKENLIHKLTEAGYFNDDDKCEQAGGWERFKPWLFLLFSLALFVFVCYFIVSVILQALPLLVLTIIGIPILLLGIRA